ncbi:MAG: DNA polymerase Y family protein, partial [Ilumatobacteraceae bacterium]
TGSMAAGGGPVAVVHLDRVVARSSVAAEAGVRAGQRRRDAQRCCPELEFVEHDPARDARAFEPVVRAVAELAPQLDVVDPGWITLAARGPTRYFGGDRAVAERLVRTVRDATGGALAGVGVADGRAASAVAARRAVATPGRVELVDPGGSPAYLAPLPIAWLRAVGDADADLIDVWVRLGLRTLGDLAALPAADVLARFGPVGAHAHRLATGVDARPHVPVDPAPDRQLEHVFDHPVESVSTVVFVAKQLADRLATDLADQGRVCTRLRVVAETEHGERTERSWYRDGGMSAAAMVERVRWQLDGWIREPGGISTGIVLVRLVPDEVRGDDGVQMGLWGGRTQADDDAARAVTRLIGLVGDRAVRVPAWRGGRLPADRYEWVPAATAALDDPSERLGVEAERAPWPGSVTAPSPTVVRTDPAEADLLDASGRTLRVGGRGEVSGEPAALVVGGVRRSVAAWAGPWPVEQAWWDPRRHRRLARLQVVTDDGDAHLVAAEHRRWWILASYR